MEKDNLFNLVGDKSLQSCFTMEKVCERQASKSFVCSSNHKSLQLVFEDGQAACRCDRGRQTSRIL